MIFAGTTVEILSLPTWERCSRFQNVGIASMHTAVTHTGQVLFPDRTDIGPSLINLANGVCRDNVRDVSSQHDCTSHSLMFNPVDNSVRPLLVQTDTWCSSGAFLPNGALTQTGRYNDGVQRVRWIPPCGSDGSCDWVESSTDLLQAGRRYASNQLLPDGRMFVLGGQYLPTYKFIPSNGWSQLPAGPVRAPHSGNHSDLDVQWMVAIASLRCSRCRLGCREQFCRW